VGSACRATPRPTPRRSRHPGHLDATILAELPERLAAGEWSPLDLGAELIEVDTSAGTPQAAELAARIRR
jgi:hypothetical protein